MRLYLPESWLGDPARLNKAGVPPAYRRDRTKGEIALDLLDLVRDEGLPGQIVVTDAGYGVAQEFRDRLAVRGLVLRRRRDRRPRGLRCGTLLGHAVDAGAGAPSNPPAAGRRSPPPRGGPGTGPAVAASAVELGERGPKGRCRRSSVGPGSGRAHGWATGECAEAGPVWLLIEEQADGQLKYAFSNLPAESPMSEGVAYWKSRWPVEQGYQQMKSELGLDHFEGRSWRGFHHHVCLVMVTFGFLALERRRAGIGGAAGEG